MDGSKLAAVPTNLLALPPRYCAKTDWQHKLGVSQPLLPVFLNGTCVSQSTSHKLDQASGSLTSTMYLSAMLPYDCAESDALVCRAGTPHFRHAHTPRLKSVALEGGVELRSEQFRMFLNLFGATGSPPQEDAGSASSENQGSDPSTETAGASSG